MRNKFLLSKSITSDTFSHIICVNPIAIYSLPGFELISGEVDSNLRENAIRWYNTHKENHVQTPRLLPIGYTEAIEKVKENLELINIADLADRVGVREVDIARVLNGVKYKDKPYHFSYKIRVRCKDEVEKLLL